MPDAEARSANLEARLYFYPQITTIFTDYRLGVRKTQSVKICEIGGSSCITRAWNLCVLGVSVVQSR